MLILQIITSSLNTTKNKFRFLNIDAELSLFNKQPYDSYLIDQAIYNLLFKAFTQPIACNVLSDNLFLIKIRCFLKDDNILYA